MPTALPRRVVDDGEGQHRALGLQGEPPVDLRAHLLRLGDRRVPELPELAVLHRLDQVVAMAVRERLEGGARAAQGNGLEPCHGLGPDHVGRCHHTGPRRIAKRADVERDGERVLASGREHRGAREENMASKSAQAKPIVALAMGDPAGISPELTAKLLALDEVREVAGLDRRRRPARAGGRAPGSPRSRSTWTPSAPTRRCPKPRTGRCSSTSDTWTRPRSARRSRPRRRPLRQGEFPLRPGAGQGRRRPRRGLHAVQQGRHEAGTARLRRRDILHRQRHRLQGRGARVQCSRRALERARDEPRAARRGARPALHAAHRQGARADARGDGGCRLLPAPHRRRRPQPARRRQRQLRPRGDRHHRPRRTRGKGQGHRLRRPLSLRHGVRAGARRSVRRRAHHVPRPGPDRHEADRLRQGRDPARRLPHADHDARARHRLRHRRQGHRQHRRQPQRAAARRQDGSARSRRRRARPADQPRRCAPRAAPRGRAQAA